MIDLHLHTSASDGLFAPADLVDRIARAGVTACSVTDHDTVAGLDEVSEAAAARGLRFLTGIEITAVDDGRDVHVLGYGVNPGSPALLSFLMGQRQRRLVRVRQVLERLATLGLPIDERRVVTEPATSPRAFGRPHIARAMIEAGYVRSVSEAFEKWLGTDGPAFVPRDGASAAEAVATIHGAGGVASLAHPGITRRDGLIPALVEHGLDALEVWHSEHDAETSARYEAMASALGLLTTGGSDFHGDDTSRSAWLGRVGLSESAFAALLAAVARRANPPCAAPDRGREPFTTSDSPSSVAEPLA